MPYMMNGIGRDIWEATQKESRFLITQDLDFSGTYANSPMVHFMASCSSVSTQRKGETWLLALRKYFRKKNVGEWAGCLVVASEPEIRLLKPENKQNGHVRPR